MALLEDNEGNKKDMSDWTTHNETQQLWAAPEARLNAGELMLMNDWAISLRPLSSRSMEWYFECNFLGSEALREVAEVNTKRRGGVPVLKGTRFTLSQALAELADSSGAEEVARNFDIDVNIIKEMLEGLSLVLLRPMVK